MARFLSFGTRAAGESYRNQLAQQVVPGSTIRRRCPLGKDHNAVVFVETPTFSPSGTQILGPAPGLYRLVFVLKTGIPWEDLPQEMGCRCGISCLHYP
jgi:hypothetical protein